MKIFSLIFLILVFTFTNFGQTKGDSVIITSGDAVLRGTANSSGAIVTQLVKGEKATFLLQMQDWYLIQSAKYVGWIHNSSVQLVTATTTQTTNIKLEAVYLDAADDEGYDIVRISEPGRLYPYLGSTSPTTIPAGGVIILLQRKHSTGFLNVLDVETGKVGWIYYKDVKIYFTQKPRQDGNMFRATPSNNNQPPEVTITNNTDRILTIKLGDENYTIQPSSFLKISLSRGVYDFYAFAPRAYPLIGSKSFDTGYRYTWTFYISK